ncbi:MAG: [protein-PII] uridylyltransferase [Betaproteobacteria bacterium]|nr:[protein-PII] uridylyltransferase [Betaproteobacteria bacterium]
MSSLSDSGSGENLRQRLAAQRQQLRAAYEAAPDPKHLLTQNAKLVDAALGELWTLCQMPPSASLVAVGGYGRGELFPYSDVDILILLADEPSAALTQTIECMVSRLWDLGLDIGHSVRTVEQCAEVAAADVTVQTNLLEARLLTGSQALFDRLIEAARQFKLEAFFIAKRAEQEQRYNRFNDTPYALEPNCKESPGGLRDLQMLTWIALAAGYGTSWEEIAARGLITHAECAELEKVERLLQNIRISLHHLAQRREDRLLFDYQEALAQHMDIAGTPTQRASEVLMQRYFLAAKKVTQLNTLLLQNMAARVFPSGDATPETINPRFNKRQGLLDITHDTVFLDEPEAILEAFLIMQQHADLKGMTARTLRALWNARIHVDEAFRQKPENRARFLALFQQKRGLTHEFRRMNQYGILGRYLPAFGRIVGQMQHDLFHVYTVDQHILQVMRNLRRFTMEEHAHEYPLCTRLMSAFEQPWLLYIAGLFHDIAKGRGGDHSQLGMQDAYEFCVAHGLSEDDTALIGWLVEQHLTMSRVAQKSDLSDPDVIRNFAELVGNEHRLIGLYLLTHADIRGTSPKVWNGWKAKLLEDLFYATRHLLRGNTPEQVKGLAERQEEARVRLRYFGLAPDTENAFWKELDTVYFMRHSIDEIVWHTRMLYYRPTTAEPVVKARPSHIDRGLQVMVYAPDSKDLFLRLCGFFSKQNLSILDAKIHTTQHGYALDSFVLLYPDGEEENYRDIVSLIEHELVARLQSAGPPDQPSKGRLSRQLRHFPIAPEVSIAPDERGQYHILSVTAADRPGLLYTIASILTEHGINLHTAKISTLGERAEDTFLISGTELSSSSATVKIESALLEQLRI